MAFAATNVKVRNVGGGLRTTTGQWTGSDGDAPGTLTVSGARVQSAQFRDNTTGFLCDVTFAAGSAANTSIVTINNISAVTDGYFKVDAL